MTVAVEQLITPEINRPARYLGNKKGTKHKPFLVNFVPMHCYHLNLDDRATSPEMDRSLNQYRMKEGLILPVDVFASKMRSV